MEADFSDNYFDLLPEVPAVVHVLVPGDISGDELLRRLSVRSVVDTR
jgi:hypothetical protein